MMPLCSALTKERARGFISVVQNRPAHSTDLAELWVTIIITHLYFYKIILPSEPSTEIPWELPLCI